MNDCVIIRDCVTTSDCVIIRDCVITSDCVIIRDCVITSDCVIPTHLTHRAVEHKVNRVIYKDKYVHKISEGDINVLTEVLKKCA